MRLSSAIRTAAVLEAGKGALVMLAGLGSLSLIDHDIQRFAENLVAHTHLNPAARYPRIFVELADHLTDGRILLLATGAAVYTCVRFIEAYGLWFQRRWAEWFAAVSGGIYIPFELFELYERISLLSLGVLLINSAIVAFMVYSLSYTQRKNSAHAV